MWAVVLTNPCNGERKILKQYPFKLQCVIWCYMKGFVMTGYDDMGPYKLNTFLVYWPATNSKLTIEEEPVDGRV